MDREVGADEAAWRLCFVAARDAAPSEWSDRAVEIMTVLVMAGAEVVDDRATHDALLWFLRHRTDVLHEATRWAGMEMVTFRPTHLLGEYSNERALVALHSLRDELAGCGSMGGPSRFSKGYAFSSVSRWVRVCMAHTAPNWRIHQ